MSFSSLSAELLKSQRQQLGLSQAEAAAACGVSREIWGRYERGAAVPGGEVLAAFAKLGADMQLILTGAENASTSTHLSTDEEMLIDAYRELDQAARKTVLKALLSGGALDAKQAGNKVSVKGSGNRVAGSDYHEN